MTTQLTAESQRDKTGPRDAGAEHTLNAGGRLRAPVARIEPLPLPRPGALTAHGATLEKSVVACAALEGIALEIRDAVATPAGRAAAGFLDLLRISLESGSADLPLGNVYAPTAESNATAIVFGEVGNRSGAPFLSLRSYTGPVENASRHATPEEEQALDRLAAQRTADGNPPETDSGADLLLPVGIEDSRLVSYIQLHVRLPEPAQFMDLRGDEFHLVLHRIPEADGVSLGVQAFDESTVTRRLYGPAALTHNEMGALSAFAAVEASAQPAHGSPDPASPMGGPVLPELTLLAHKTEAFIRPRRVEEPEVDPEAERRSALQLARYSPAGLAAINPFAGGLELERYLPQRSTGKAISPQQRELACVQFGDLVGRMAGELRTPSGTAAAETLRAIGLALELGFAEEGLGVVYGPDAKTDAAGVDLGSNDRIGHDSHLSVRRYRGPVPKPKRAATPEEMAVVAAMPPPDAEITVTTASGLPIGLPPEPPSNAPTETNFTAVHLRFPQPVELFHVTARQFDVVLYHDAERDGATLAVTAFTDKGVAEHRYAPLSTADDPPVSRALPVDGSPAETREPGRLLQLADEPRRQLGPIELRPMERIAEVWTPYRRE